MRNVHRRSFLRGAAGAVMALPWLESVSNAATPARPPRRLAFYYVPIGVVRRDFFPGEESLKPINFKDTNGREYEKLDGVSVGSNPLTLTPTLRPLEALRHKVTLVTGLHRKFQSGTDVHAQAASCYLTSANIYEIKSSAYPLARSLDHIVADQVGDETPFRTLEFSCNSHRDHKESIHFDNISWYGTDQVAPSMREPTAAYRRLFRTAESEAASRITDLVLDDARDLRRELGADDRRKFAEYFDSIRAIERQMDRLTRLRRDLSKVDLGEPAADWMPRGEYIRFMGDLMVVALQAGLTRVATFMVGPERWNTPTMYEGVFDKPVSHHNMSHDQVAHVNDLSQIDLFHMRQFMYLLERMDGVREADGSTLLDNTIFTYGSGLGDGATHQYERLPIIVAGGGAQGLKTGFHLRCQDDTPLANLWLTQAQVMGVERKSFADSDGVIADLLA